MTLKIGPVEQDFFSSQDTCTQMLGNPRLASSKLWSPGGGGVVTWKMYTPARTAPRNPYPHWHKNCETLYPYWHKIWAEIYTLTGINPQKGYRERKFHISLAQPLEKPYPFWHTFGVQNSTLSGTLLENPTLCGTEVGQYGTLAILAYVYCRQWECPAPFGSGQS